MNVLFVCLDNVCRSPIAEAFLKKKYKENDIQGIVDSSGFESFTINEPPDPRAVEIAKKYNIKLKGTSRIFVKADFNNFDKIYVMDMQNYMDVKDLARSQSDLEKMDYLLNVLYPGKNKTIHDPYLQGVHDCEMMAVELDKATTKIVENIQSI